MTPTGLLVAVSLTAMVLGCAWYVSAIERAPVTRARLRAFAFRQGLTVTAANGNQVIRYLALTRRWRATGLVVGLLVASVWAISEEQVRVDFVTLFAGWFAGALVAEFRLARAPSGPHRTASLRRRDPAAYLSRTAWLLLPTAAAISLVVGGASLVAVLNGRKIGAGAVLWCAIAIVVASVVMFVQRRVLNRPQGLYAADVLEADDAIRSRSLHVLAGGGTSLVLYCVLGQLAEAATATSEFLAGAWFLGVFAVPLLGWLVATSHWPVSRAGGRLAGGGMP